MDLTDAHDGRTVVAVIRIWSSCVLHGDPDWWRASEVRANGCAANARFFLPSRLGFSPGLPYFLVGGRLARYAARLIEFRPTGLMLRAHQRGCCRRIISCILGSFIIC